jgi:hypothetical protein
VVTPENAVGRLAQPRGLFTEWVAKEWALISPLVEPRWVVRPSCDKLRQGSIFRSPGDTLSCDDASGAARALTLGLRAWNGRDHALAGEEPGRDTGSAPSPNGGDGRDARGRLAPGNQRGSGNGPRPDEAGANRRPEGDITRQHHGAAVSKRWQRSGRSGKVRTGQPRWSRQPLGAPAAALQCRVTCS